MSAELHWRWISLSGPYGKQLCIRKDSRVEQSAQLADDCKHLLVPLTDQQVGLLSSTGRWLRAGDDGYLRSTGSRCQSSEHFTLVLAGAEQQPEVQIGLESHYSPASTSASSAYVSAASADSHLALIEDLQPWTVRVHDTPSAIIPGTALLLQLQFGRTAGPAKYFHSHQHAADAADALLQRRAAILQWAAGLEQSVLEQFAPAIKLHPYEQAFPCSIEHILQHSTLKSVKQPDWSGLRSPSPDVLGRCRKAAEDAALAQELGLPANQGEQALYLDIQADAYKGFSPGSSHGEYVSSDSHTVCAPMYVSIERYANKDYVDLHYIMLYAYQACQTFRITTLAGAVTSLFSRKTPTTDHFVIHDFGRHQGDIERVCVRVDPGFTKIYAVGFERHGKDCWDPANSMRFPRDQLELEGGTHTVVCAAMNGHASYNSRERGTTDFTKTTVADSPLKGEHAFKTGGVEGVWGIDLCDDAHGPVWRPWTAGSRVVLLNRDELNGNVLAGAEWATFQGGLGAPLHNKFRGATHIDGCKVDLAKGLQLRAINIGAKVAQCAVPKFHLPGAGGGAPAGLGNRPYMRMWSARNDPTYTSNV